MEAVHRETGRTLNTACGWNTTRSAASTETCAQGMTLTQMSCHRWAHADQHNRQHGLTPGLVQYVLIAVQPSSQVLRPQWLLVAGPQHMHRRERNC